HGKLIIVGHTVAAQAPLIDFRQGPCKRRPAPDTLTALRGDHHDTRRSTPESPPIPPGQVPAAGCLHSVAGRGGRAVLPGQELGIDDSEPSLTPEEKKATLGDLLKARSGVYHPALYETPGMKAARPRRSSHAHGTFWYYNNWDFNVLGTVFERQTKNSLFREF